MNNLVQSCTNILFSVHFLRISIAISLAPFDICTHYIHMFVRTLTNIDSCMPIVRVARSS